MTITPSQHLAALALVVLDVVARGVRICVLLPGSVLRAMAVNTCGDALAAVTPARLGGEPLRFLAFQRSGATAPAVLAAFVTEVVVDAVMMIVIGVGLAPAFASVGLAWLTQVVQLAASPAGRRVTVAILAALAFGGLVAFGVRRRWPPPLVQGSRDAWRILSTRSPWVLARVTVLTFVSMAARSAILPVLAAGVSGVSFGSLLAGSFVLGVMQALLPIPSGVGAVDLGFAASFTGTLGGSDLARLLLVWRFYTIALGALVGMALLASSKRTSLAATP